MKGMGMFIGGLAGLGAGWLWCHYVIPKLRQKLPGYIGQEERPNLRFCVSRGMSLGALAGLFVHLVLMLVTGGTGLLGIDALAIGLLFGTAAGDIAGRICRSMARNAFNNLASDVRLQRTDGES